MTSFLPLYIFYVVPPLVERRLTKEVVPSGHEFLARIGRQDLENVITLQSPIFYVSPEFGLNDIGPQKGRLGYAGGLGILSGDHVRLLAKTGLPAEAVGLLHTRRMKPVLDESNWQTDVPVPIPSPQELGLETRDVQVAVAANGDVVPLTVNDLDVGGQMKLHLLYEPGLSEVYAGDKNDEHRLYQSATLGFGASQVIEMTKIVPPVIHLNEASTTFTALGIWDRKLQHHLDEGMPEDQAFALSLAETRSLCELTNHTLVPAADGDYGSDLYKRYVLKNIQSPAIKNRIQTMIDDRGGHLNVGDLAFDLAGTFNGVSDFHSKLATAQFQQRYGKVLDGDRPMVFNNVTNGIDSRWYERFYDLYRKSGIMDEYELETADYQQKVDTLTTGELRQLKGIEKAHLRHFLEKATLGNNEPRDSEGKPVPLKLPEDAVVVGWARRFADYKRPGMMIEDLAKITEIIARHPNVHIVYSGKAHPKDKPMKLLMQSLLNRVQSDPILSQHVHFVQDYDINVGKALTAGADIWVNNPRVGEEACGTSLFKAVANNALLVSTPDGGARDVDESSYIAIKGTNESEERESLYEGLERAIWITEDAQAWAQQAKKQLKAFTPVFAGGRMIKDYLNLQFPQKAEQAVGVATEPAYA